MPMSQGCERIMRIVYTTSMFTCSWRGVREMFKYFSFPSFIFSHNMISISTSQSLNNNVMTTLKAVDFNNKIG